MMRDERYLPNIYILDHAVEPQGVQLWRSLPASGDHIFSGRMELLAQLQADPPVRNNAIHRAP
jgi:hypothetical protein